MSILQKGLRWTRWTTENLEFVQRVEDTRSSRSRLFVPIIFLDKVFQQPY